LLHYTLLGIARGQSPNPYFDESWYLSTYPDVRDVIANGAFPSGFAHYCATGYLSRNPHWLFNDHMYRARRGDLSFEELSSNGLRNGYHHYLIAGQNEGSTGSMFFDPAVLQDIAGIVDVPFTTLLTAPWLGNLKLSHYFDPDWYMAMYEDVEDAIADGLYGCALHHYLCNPTPQNYAGSPDFDEAFYGSRYPDIGEAIRAGALRNGYTHFVEHGRSEDRQPSPWFDPTVYKGDKSVAQDLRDNPTLTAFDHYLRYGRRRGLATVQAPHRRSVEQRPGTEEAGKDIFARMAHLWASSAASAGIAFDTPATPDISVVMCAFNHYDLTIQTLLHLSGSTGVSFEVILIDNASLDATRHIERCVKGLRLIRNTTNAGFLLATNQGIAAARGRYVLLLNNDVILPPNALLLAMKRLEGDLTVGAVGGKVVRTHGQLQEAGCMLFSNGSALGYGRDRDPYDPEFNFVRDVDYCSGVFLMLPAPVLAELGGLDVDYAPAYYEETDLCVRVWKRGLRVVYDPAVVIIHLEFGSSRNPDAPRALMRRNRDIFVAKHRDWLGAKMLPNLRAAINGRTATRRPRVLLIEDTIPYRHIGSGFVRSADVVASLVDIGCDVTVYPMNPVVPQPDPREGFDETVELLWNHDITHAAAFLAERETYYDHVWVCRAHNLHRLTSVIGSGNWGPFTHAHVVLDTEALACNREAAFATLEGSATDIGRALRRELRQSYLVQDICCVNEMEAQQLRDAGLPRVHVLGHAMEARPTPNGFAARRDILALGSLYAADTPNFDGLRWFISEVWPLVRAALGDVRLLVAGYVADGLDAAGLLAGPGVVHLGFVEDARELYNEARVFLAPTRFAAGIPFKVHEAASMGVPVMATDLLARQLGWQAGLDIVACSAGKPAVFGGMLMALYSDEILWNTIRNEALERIKTECSCDAFTSKIGRILKLNVN
jgi:GT2 family glycosyltransferase